MMTVRDQAMAFLEYDEATGLFRWRVARKRHGKNAEPGDVAGTPHDGYVVIGVHGRQYRAHRLAWLFMTGEWPPKGYEVDHRDTDRANNRWANLRLATRSQNNVNKAPPCNNRSGVMGVSFAKRSGKWVARLGKGGKPLCLGEFAEYDDAVAARRAAELEHYGRFSRAA